MGVLVIGFAGHARSGKSSIAEVVARRAQLPVASFRREVERVAKVHVI
jgi:adenosyl cobinamide kinase/adenosyl cobinamide phosphate guanylyltransferase